MAQTYNLTDNSSTGTLSIEGKLNVAAFGTFSGGSLAFELSYDGGVTWFAATDSSGDAASLGADGALNIEVGTADFRLTLSGATAPDINIVVTGVLRTSKLS